MYDIPIYLLLIHPRLLFRDVLHMPMTSMGASTSLPDEETLKRLSQDGRHGLG